MDSMLVHMLHTVRPLAFDLDIALHMDPLAFVLDIDLVDLEAQKKILRWVVSTV